MTTRDLSYLVDFSVTGSSELSDAATDMDTLSTKADDLGDTPVDFDFNVGDGLSTAAGDIDDVGESIVGLGDTAETEAGRTSGLRGALGDLGLTSLGLGTAFDLVSTAVGTLSGWFDALGVKADITAAGSEAAADSVFGLFEALTTLQSVSFDTDTGLGALNEAFRTGIEAAAEGDVQKVSDAMVLLGINFDNLSQTMLDFQANEAETFAQIAADAGIPLELANALGEAATHGDSVNDSLRNLGDDGVRAFGEAVGLTGGQLNDFVAAINELDASNKLGEDSFLNALPGDAREAGEAILEQVGAIEQLDDAAENTSETLGHLIDTLAQSPEGAAALAEVREAMPDASDTEVLQALVDRLAEIDGAAEGAAEGLDEVGVDREATITATEEGSEEVRAELEDAANADYDATITAEADTAAADSDITAFENIDRTVGTYLSLVNGPEFDQVIDNHTDERTISVDIATGTITLPTASDLAARIGTVRVPIDGYIRYVPRIDGTRARS